MTHWQAIWLRLTTLSGARGLFRANERGALTDECGLWQVAEGVKAGRTPPRSGLALTPEA